MLWSSALKCNGRWWRFICLIECVWSLHLYLKFPPVFPIYCASGHFWQWIKKHYVSRITVIIAWLNCLVINENFSSCVNVFTSMFSTRFVAFRFIISNSIPDWKLMKVGRLFWDVCWRFEIGGWIFVQLFICSIVHMSCAQSYVTDMLHKKRLHTRNTRSSSYTMPLLNRPAHSKATLGDRSFSFASSSVWNSIQNDVRCAPSLSSFKSRLKTYLFRSDYKDWTVSLITVHMCMVWPCYCFVDGLS